MDAVNPWVALFLFWLYVASDGLYALWTIAVNERKAVKAGAISAVLFVLLSIGVISYVDSHWYIVPCALGSGAGTYVATRFSKTRPEATRDE